MVIRIILSLFLFLSALNLRSQEIPLFSHYFMNPYLYNPAYAGSEGRGTLFLTHRRQWVGIEDAPVTSNLTLHGPLSRGLSMGFNLTHDERSILATSRALLTLGYVVRFSPKVFLRFGISGGVGFNNLDLSDQGGLVDLSDPSLSLENNLFLDGNAGLSLHLGNLNLAASMPKIFSENTLPDSVGSFETGEISPQDEFIFYAAYRAYLANNDFIFEPRIFYRLSGNDTESDRTQYEVMAIFHIKNALWIGAGYREDKDGGFSGLNGFSGMLGIKFKSNLAIGYSMGIGPAEFAQLDNATHEIQLNLGIGKRGNKNVPHVYSFVDLERKFAPSNINLTSTDIDENSNRGTEVGRLSAVDRDGGGHTFELVSGTGDDDNGNFTIGDDRLQANREFDYEEQTQHNIRIRTTDSDGNTYEKSFIISVNNLPDEEIVEEDTVVEKDTVETVVKDTIETIAEIDTTVTEELEEIEEEDKDDEPVVVKRGDHLLEIPVGHYVVVGAFSKLENAQNYSDRLFDLGYHASFGFLTEKQYYYVYLFQTDTPEKARKERDRLRQIDLFKDAWYLVVE